MNDKAPPHRRPLSAEAAAVRRPPEPGVLVGALQDRPSRQAKARVGRAVRVAQRMESDDE